MGLATPRSCQPFWGPRGASSARRVLTGGGEVTPVPTGLIPRRFIPRKCVKPRKVNVAGLLCQTYGATAPMLDLPYGSDRASHQDEEQPPVGGVGCEVLLGDHVLSLSSTAIN